MYTSDLGILHAICAMKAMGVARQWLVCGASVRRACVYCTNLAKPSGRWYCTYRNSRLLAASCGVGCRKGTSSATTSGSCPSAGAGGRGTGLCTVSAHSSPLKDVHGLVSLQAGVSCCVSRACFFAIQLLPLLAPM